MIEATNLYHLNAGPGGFQVLHQQDDLIPSHDPEKTRDDPMIPLALAFWECLWLSLTILTYILIYIYWHIYWLYINYSIQKFRIIEHIELQLHELHEHSLLLYVSAWLEHSGQPWLWVRVALSFKRNSAKDGASYDTKSNSIKATDCHSIHIYHHVFGHDSMCICISSCEKYEWNAGQNTQQLISFSRKTLLSVSLRPHISVGSSSKTTLQHRIPGKCASYWLTFSGCTRCKRHVLISCVSCGRWGVHFAEALHTKAAKSTAKSMSMRGIMKTQRIA